MIRVSLELERLAREYLEHVSRGDLSEERSWLHDRMMTQMRAEGIAYRNREDARNKAYWFTSESSIVIAYWSLLLDFLGEVLDELRIQACSENLCAPC